MLACLVENVARRCAAQMYSVNGFCGTDDETLTDIVGIVTLRCSNNALFVCLDFCCSWFLCVCFHEIL